MSEALLKFSKFIALYSGFGHDFGKCSDPFQSKLRKPEPIKDDVRHEWLSMFIAHELMDGLTWSQAVKSIQSRKPCFSDPSATAETLIFRNHISSLRDVLLFCIATHHKLPAKDHRKITNDHHVNHDDGHRFVNPLITLSPGEEVLEKFRNVIGELKVMEAESEGSRLFYRAVATFARMALILADQSVSAEWHPVENIDPDLPLAYANTMKRDGKKVLNQSLSWHLLEVGRRATSMAENMLTFNAPEMSRATREALRKPSMGAFAWQNIAVAALNDSRGSWDGHLVLVIADTGKGKTLANLKIADALRGDAPLRLTTAINLRTLTLQTAEAYGKIPGVEKNDIALVVGDSLTVRLQRGQLENDDEDESESSPIVHANVHHQLPEWLAFYSDKNPRLGPLLISPLVVSTIDFVVAAGEPHRKHHHILAAMKVMHSDLILDEIDGYDPKALLAVLRLVQEAGRWGRNVIASSATLSKPVARLLWQAYDHGLKMRQSVEGGNLRFQTSVIDDRMPPSLGSFTTHSDFSHFYEEHVKAMLRLPKVRSVVPEIAKIKVKSESGFLKAIGEAILKMHTRHFFQDPETGKRVSIGLVRIANIKVAVKVADFIARHMKMAKVCCYHANIPELQRYLLEKKLDQLLTRKGDNPNERILSDPDIRSSINGIDGRDVLFIVVATPIEEIGRDHDFDWGIAEPSSSQSLVQTAGRVKRHRRSPVETPNFAILQYCYKSIMAKNEKVVFTKPGLERELTGRTTHKSHDIAELFDWNSLHFVSAAMRFESEKHAFAAYDDLAIELAVKDTFASMLTEDHLWMAKETYSKTPLREFQETLELRPVSIGDVHYRVSAHDFNEGREEETRLREIISRVSNDWLVWSDDELNAEAKSRNIDPREAMRTSIPLRRGDATPAKAARESVRRHLSFGYFLDSST